MRAQLDQQNTRHAPTHDARTADTASIFHQGTILALNTNDNPDSSQTIDTKKITKIPSLVKHNQIIAKSYSPDQDQFDLNTKVQLQKLKQSVSTLEIGQIGDLISTVGDMRKQAGQGEPAKNVGVVRHNATQSHTVETPGDNEKDVLATIVMPMGFNDPKSNRYAKLTEGMMASLEERELKKDPNLLVLDSNTLFDDDTFMKTKNGDYYRQLRYVMPHYETDSGEKIRLTGTRVAIADTLPDFFYEPPRFLFSSLIDTIEAIDEMANFYCGLPLKEPLPYAKNEDATEITIVHCNFDHLTAAHREMDHQFDQFKLAYDSGDQEKAFDHAIDLVYLFANAAPYERGSAWGSEMIATALTQCIYEDAQADFFKTNLDFIAFGLDQYEFKEQFKDYVARSSNQQANS